MKLSRPASQGFWFLWHALAGAAIFLIAVYVMPGGVHGVHRGNVLVPAAPALAYLFSAAVLSVWLARGAQVRMLEVAGVLALGFGALFLLLLLQRADYSRAVLIATVLAAGSFGMLSVSLTRALQKPALYAAGGLVALGFVATVAARGLGPTLSPSSLQRQFVRTSFYNLVVESHGPVLQEQVVGGGIARFGDRYLVATGAGRLVVFSWDPETRELHRRVLPEHVPLNRAAFAEAVGPEGAESTRSFRVGGLLVRDEGERFKLFVSHHHWNAEGHCYTVRVSETEGGYATFGMHDRPEAKWRTVYESSPCLPFKKIGMAFDGFQIGGRMVMLDDEHLLLTVGDHAFDGVESYRALPQDASADYGKTVLIDLASGASSVYTSGHRNPEGLTLDASGNVWETEHGPKGGDELNRIEQGKDYGWPRVTYGTDYGESVWPPSSTQGRHDGFQRPVFAWIPSIGISSLIRVKPGLFDIWRGDLLVSSLRDESLWRVRVREGRALFTERIEIGARIRDFVQDKDGRLVMWTEALSAGPTPASIVIVEPADAPDVLARLTSVERGEVLFSSCNGCHRVQDGQTHKIGPDLKGVYGRHAASAAGFAYTDAMRAFDGDWTDKNLDAFLEDPRSFLPGTSMGFKGMPDADKRADIIEYLKSNR